MNFFNSVVLKEKVHALAQNNLVSEILRVNIKCSPKNSVVCVIKTILYNKLETVVINLTTVFFYDQNLRSFWTLFVLFVQI